MVYLFVLLLMIALTRAMPEGVGQVVRRANEVSLRPRIGVPRTIRAAFIAPAAMAFATFALGGFYAALTPGLLSQSLQQRNPATVGGLVALFFGIGAVAAAMSDRVGGRAAILASTLLLLIGLTLLVAAERTHSMQLLVIATFISGIAVARGFRCSLQIVNQIAPEAHRAELVSSYLLVCYTANSLPVIGVGLLSLAVAPPTAHLWFAALLALLALVACATGWKYVPAQSYRPA